MSRLLGDPVYESLARRAVQSLWTIRNNDTGLFGTNMNIQSGQWISNMSGMLDKLPYNVQIGIPTQKKFGKKYPKLDRDQKEN